jgi:FAD/FMN-containing dehydrogenase
MTAIAAPAGFDGELIAPSHPRYDEARAHFDPQIDRRPASIAMCRTEADVQAVVRHARARGLPIAVRSGGHSVPGYSVVDGGVVIDLSRSKGIRVDADARRAFVQPGLTAVEVQDALAAHGLVAAAGIEADPGFVGLAIHGGRGTLGRRHGWASDHIRGARLVTADGDLLVVSAEAHADLLYGLRGLGSSFGIVTELEVDVHPIPDTILGGARIYGPDAVPRLVPPLLELFETDLSDDIDALFTFFVDQGALHLELALLHVGPADVAEQEIARIDALAAPLDDGLARRSYPDFLRASEHPPLDRFVWAEQSSNLPVHELAASLLELAAGLPSSTTPGLPNHYLVFEPSGPSFARPTDLPTPVPRRRLMQIAFFGCWSDPDMDAPMNAWAADSARAVHESGVGNGIPVLNYNSVTGPGAVRRAYGDDAYRRLRDLKRTYDPDGAFRLNHGEDLPDLAG